MIGQIWQFSQIKGFQIVPHFIRGSAVFPSDEGTGVGISLEGRGRNRAIEQAVLDAVLSRMSVTHNATGVGFGGDYTHRYVAVQYIVSLCAKGATYKSCRVHAAAHRACHVEVPDGGQGIKNTNAAVKVEKFYRDGQLIIRKNGTDYNVMGVVIR